MNTSQCAQCGQVDDHPKVHVGTLAGGIDETLHHDCLPYHLQQQLVRDTEHGAAIIAAAQSGTRGDALRDVITQLHATTTTKEA